MPSNLPTDKQRISIVGRTGSGKTVAAMHHLSQRQFDVRPWVIYNFKHDENLDAIPGVKLIELDDLPVKPGLYMAHPGPYDSEALEAHMMAIWAAGNMGLYVDEGYMVDRNSRAFSLLQTQGRSKHIPMITLSQRPVWLNRFVFSESDFFQIFQLQHKKDRDKIGEYVPANIEERLPAYHSYYYDVAEDKLDVWSPVPSIDKIHAVFDRRLSRRLQAV